MGLTFEIDTSGLEGFKDRLKRKVRQQMARAVSRAAEEGAWGAIAAGQYQNHTWNLRSTIHATEAGARTYQTADGGEGATSVWAEIVAPMHYASFVNYGTSRSRAYPFMDPPGVKVAQAALEREIGALVVSLRFEE